MPEASPTLRGRSRIAHELGVSVATASRLKRRGLLRVRQLGGIKNSIWVVDRAELERLRGGDDPCDFHVQAGRSPKIGDED